MKISGNYFDALTDLSQWMKNHAATNAVLALKVASYFTVAIPLFVAVINYCWTGSLLGRVKEQPGGKTKAGNAFQHALSPSDDLEEGTPSGKLALENAKELAQQNQSLQETVLALKQKIINLEAKMAAHQAKLMSHAPVSKDQWKVESLMIELEQVKQQLQEAQKEVKQAETKGNIPLEGIPAELVKTKAALFKKSEEAAQANARADNLLARAGKSHIKRDWMQTKMDSSFPAGEDYRNEFLAAFLDFESFACDVVNVIEDAEKVDGNVATETLVNDVMKPLYINCQTYIRDLLESQKKMLQDNFGIAINENDPKTKETVPTLFWYKSMQPQILRMVDNLTEEKVNEIMGDSLVDIHHKMLIAATEERIAFDENALRIPQVARSLLRLMAIAALSDPACYLSPTPGQRMKFKEGFMQEVLSPGTRKHGRIQEGDEVEVVQGGLYFEELTEANLGTLRPVVVPMVRRLIKAKT